MSAQDEVSSVDILIRDGIFAEIAPSIEYEGIVEKKMGGAFVGPGFVQAHTHLCQTLFRGMAEDLELLSWLGDKIWPMEAAHDEESAYWSARLGLTELLLSGTTSILDMGTLKHTDAIFMACEEAGVRATVGRAMMDRPNPAGLSMNAEANLKGACEEADRWHGKGRLKYGFAPRFVPSCTEGLLLETIIEARKRGALLHTHASENLDELDLVRSLTGKDNIQYLGDIGMLGEDVCLAHCVHLDERGYDLLSSTGTNVVHCPSSNLKLASGIADTSRMVRSGINVALGADGAACSNRLDIFSELRLAALIQKIPHGVDALSPEQVYTMATSSGAKALGEKGGEIAVGSNADMVVYKKDHFALTTGGNIVSALVYAATPDVIDEVWIGGDRIVQNGTVAGWSTSETIKGVVDSIVRLKAKLR